MENRPDAESPLESRREARGEPGLRQRKKAGAARWMALYGRIAAMAMLVALVYLADRGSFNPWIYRPLPMEWVTVPAGKFQMGCHPERNGGNGCRPNEWPLHSIYLDTYQIGKFEVTNRQYALCVRAGICAAPDNSRYDQDEFEDHPVTDVSWVDANSFCRWSRKGGRLPTEAEWEKAARGESPQTYPWGDGKPDCMLANAFNDATDRHCVGGPTAVGSYPTGASPYGALDMAGNVWEWVGDWYDDYSKSAKNNPVGPDEGLYRVVRGGSWDHYWYQTRTAWRAGSYPLTHNSLLGFRCASPSGN